MADSPDRINARPLSPLGCVAPKNVARLYFCKQGVAGSNPVVSTERICQILWQTDHMRTTLELDDALLAALMARLPGVSKTEAIQRAVRFYLAYDTVEQLRSLAGTIEIEDVSQPLRRVDRTS